MEQLAVTNPGGYRRRVMVWAAAGYGFLLCVVLGLLLLVGVLVASVLYLRVLAIKLLIFVVPVLWAVLRSAWVRFQPPTGLVVSRADAPELFSMLDELRSRLDTPPIHVVLLTREVNAGVQQHPRLGMLGWHSNYLILGLPLMKGLTPEQFKAVLAHELGHLSRGHARMGNWIYRLRLIWARLAEQLQGKSGLVAGPIAKFFVWYTPRFEATSFPLARANEYEADAASVRLTSPAVAAQALTGVNMVSTFLEQKYWPRLQALARETPTPPAAPISGFVAHDIVVVPEGERTHWLEQILARKTSLADTHPSLSDRLAAIGAPAQFVPAAAGQGADQLLGARRAAFERQLDQDWLSHASESWRKAYERAARGRERLAELRAAPEGGLAEEATARERADLEESLGEGSERSMELRREGCNRFPQSLILRFLLARQLLAEGQSEGVALMESVGIADSDAAVPVAECLRDYYAQAGDVEAARRWRAEVIKATQHGEESRRERGTVRSTDRFLPHGLEPAAVDNLRRQLLSFDGLVHATVVRKATVHRQDEPLYVVGISATRWYRLTLDAGAKARELVPRISKGITFPGDALIVAMDGRNKAFAKAFARVAGSRVI
jgi:Zn-dependent protease with chaperone function